jgi:N-acetylmuramoyl-L-alanine amidase
MRKRVLISAAIVLVCSLLLVRGRGAQSAIIVLAGSNGPSAASVDTATALAQARNCEGDAALVEGALRLLVAGLPGQASYFPRGTQADRVACSERGYTLYLTFPPGFADPGNEPIADDMMAALAGTMQNLGGAPVRVMARDDQAAEHVSIGDFFRPLTPIPRKPYEDRAAKVGPPGYGQPQPTGFLAGKSMFLSPGHGWYDAGGGDWQTQRGNTNGIVEDFSNGEAVLQFLQQYLFNAGAGVYPVRERDMNTDTQIIDNTDAGFSTTGSWGTSTSVSGYYGANYRTAQVSTTETATATFTAAIPADGFYHVYIWYTSASNRSTDCRITVSHADGDTLVIQNLRRDGFTWKDIGSYYFLADDPAERRKVTISNQGSDPNTYVVADAVRFGGGVHPDAGKPRWEMSGMYHAPFMGCDDCVTNTVTTMPLYCAWENEADWEDSLYLSWHTNAPNPGTGTSTFAYASGGWDEPFDGVEGSLELRYFVHNELVDDIRAGWDSGWGDRGEHTNWYGEINPNYNDEMPGIIFEVAFHDTPSDAEKLKEPGFRQLAARAVYQAVVRYYADRDGESPLFLPEPPKAPAVKWNNGHPIVSWDPPDYDYGGLAGDPAESYRLYVSVTGKGFADAIEVKDLEASLPADGKSGVVRFGRITAVNEGGESFPTETLAISTGSGPRVLIVNGFDRLDKYANVPEPYYGGGTIYRGYLQRMNSFDYVIAHARSLSAAGIDFDSASNEAVATGAVDLADYPAVVWICGDESTADTTFTATEQALLAEYLDAGGRLFVSGDEIGWDLWQYGSDADRAFYTNYLRATYIADSSDTGSVSAGGIFAGIADFTFDYDDYQIYAASYPDVIGAAAGGSVDLHYAGNQGAAVVDDAGAFRVVYLGFPFETIFSADTRADLMAAAMDFLLADDDDDDNDDDDNDDDNDNDNDDDDNDDDDDDDDDNDDNDDDDNNDDDDDNNDDDNDDAADDDDNDDVSGDDDASPAGGDDDDNAGCGC